MLVHFSYETKHSNINKIKHEYNDLFVAKVQKKINVWLFFLNMIRSTVLISEPFSIVKIRILRFILIMFTCQQSNSAHIAPWAEEVTPLLIAAQSFP